MKQIDLEEGGKAPVTKDADPNGTYSFSAYSLPGTWKVRGNAGQKKGLYVLGGGGSGNGYLLFTCPDEKTWCWTKINESYKNEFDNEVTISVTGSPFSSPIQGNLKWTGGEDGKFWDYRWNHTNEIYEAFNGTDLSTYYDRIPRGTHSITFNTSTWDITFVDNGDKAHVLAPGMYRCYDQSLEIPNGCIALMFHIGNLKPYNSTWAYKDIDRFIFSPLEYIIVFEKK